MSYQYQQPYAPPGSSVPPSPKQSSFKFNGHGVVGVVAIGVMLGVAFLQNWNIDWLYFVIAVVAYSATILNFTSVEYLRRSVDIRWMYGAHIAFLLLAGGLWINIRGFFIQVGIFIAAVAVGLAIPFLLVRKR